MDAKPQETQLLDLLIAVISITVVALLAIAVTHTIEEDKARKPYGL